MFLVNKQRVSHIVQLHHPFVLKRKKKNQDNNEKIASCFVCRIK